MKKKTQSLRRLIAKIFIVGALASLIAAPVTVKAAAPKDGGCLTSGAFWLKYEAIFWTMGPVFATVWTLRHSGCVVAKLPEPTDPNIRPWDEMVQIAEEAMAEDALLDLQP